ncbi:hypothetical protein ART_4191 [Arthrobacter sp. PAMC 25486]|nr:hypothetical protein ART_4191 [Arthrobacter sp. PAMC 25486]
MHIPICQEGLRQCRPKGPPHRHREGPPGGPQEWPREQPHKGSPGCVPVSVGGVLRHGMPS